MNKTDIINQDLNLVDKINVLRNKALQQDKTLRYNIFIKIVDLERKRLNLLSEIKKKLRNL